MLETCKTRLMILSYLVTVSAKRQTFRNRSVQLYIICGYVSFKENLPVSDGVVTLSYESEFTELVSRGKLKHPPPELYDLALYLYSFFKNRHSKYCSRVSLQGFMFIYESSGCQFPNIERILKRLINTFFKGYAKDRTDQIRAKRSRTTTFVREMSFCVCISPSKLL